MKKIQRFSFLIMMIVTMGYTDMVAQEPIIICPSDITISCDTDYTDTNNTGVATSTGPNGSLGVEYTDVVVDLDSNNEGTIIRRWNVVDNTAIFCDQKLTLECSDTSLECEPNVVAAISQNNNGESSVKVFAASLITSFDGFTSILASRNGVDYADFIRFDCCDIGVQTFYVQATDESGIVQSCSGLITIKDLIGPQLDENAYIKLALNENNFADLSLDLISPYIYDNCGIESASFVPNAFYQAGQYTVSYTVTDHSGNTAESSLSVIVEAGNSIVCNQNISVSLDNDGLATFTPDMILEGLAPANKSYTISINGGSSGTDATVDCSDIGELQVTITDQATGNSCWSNVTLEDKIAPIITAPTPIYLIADEFGAATLTSEMLEPYTYDNCNITFANVSQSNFVSSGTVEYTVSDGYNTTTKILEIVLTEGNVSLACNDQTNVYLEGEDNTAVINYLSSLEGNIYLNGNYTVGISEFPEEPTTYSENITLDCSHVGKNLTLTIKDEDSGNLCWGNLTVLENNKPIPYALTGVEVTMDGVNPYVLSPNQIDFGSYDDCGGVTTVVSPNTFFAPGTYEVKLIVTDDSGNSDYALTSVIVNGNNPTELECIDIATVYTEPFGPTTIHAEDFVMNDDAFTSFALSTNPNGPFSESMELDCAQYDVGNPFNLYVQAQNDTGISTCVVSLTISDVTPPVVIVESEITLNLFNGQATLTPDMVDEGSYDFCGPVTLSLSQTQFTIADIGINQVLLTATDQNGLFNQAFTNVIVVGDGGNGNCNLNDVIFPDDITISDANGVQENLTVENLQEVYGFPYESVYPYLEQECESIAIAYEDQYIINQDVIKVIRTFTAIDWLTNSVITHTQLLRLYIELNTSLACIEDLTVNVFESPVQLTAQDVLQGENYDFGSITLTITFNGQPVANNQITPNYVGQTLSYIVADASTGNECMGTITVISDEEECPFDPEVHLTAPLPEITIATINDDPGHYSPENLTSIYGFDTDEVVPVISGTCATIGYAYEDNVFYYENSDSYKINRIFTVVNWEVFEPNSQEGIYTYVQNIIIGVNPADFICDVLANDAPVGDCDTGHSLDDDVEWPADIAIIDYRITPEELVEFSGIAVKNSEPEFFNNADDYSTSYIDILINITSTDLTLARVWKVTNTVYEIDWNYSQTIEVDFSSFENLVTVSTATGRAVPEVIINNGTVTNQDGEAEVMNEIITISLEDAPLNGLNIKDLLMMAQHLEQINILTDDQLRAADINGDGSLKASDVTEFRKHLLGITEPNGEWKFIDEIDNNDLTIKPRGLYTAYKPGDVDDDAILPNEPLPVVSYEFSFEDQLLNNGETYMIPVKIEDMNSIMALELRFGIDLEMLEIVNIESQVEFESTAYAVTGQGAVVILSSNPYDDIILNNVQEDVVYMIEARAKANGLLSDAISTENMLSYAVDENLELYYISSTVDNVITGTNSVELANLSVYPNPTTDYLYIDLNDVAAKGDLQVSIFDATGKLLRNQYTSTVDVREMQAGIYLYKVTVGELETNGKFLIVK